jgi:hypothetical protein
MRPNKLPVVFPRRQDIPRRPAHTTERSQQWCARSARPRNQQDFSPDEGGKVDVRDRTLGSRPRRDAFESPVSLSDIVGTTHSPRGTYERAVLIDLCPSPTFDTACVGGQFFHRQRYVWVYNTAPQRFFSERNACEPQGRRASRHFLVPRCKPHELTHKFGEPQPHQCLTKVGRDGTNELESTRQWAHSRPSRGHLRLR